MRRTLYPLALFALTSLAPALRAEESLWSEDFEAAKALAAKEGKDLLLDFTGSDWCGWCIKLREEVFDQEAFRKDAPKEFVLVELDFPEQKPQSDELKRRNERLKAQFGVEGYPTIYLAEARGRVYAKTGYQEGGPEAYLKHLDELRGVREKRDALLAQAEKAGGLDRAKLLDQALTVVQEAAPLVGYEESLREIISLDPKNEAGLKAKYEVVLLTSEVKSAADPDAALARIDAYTKDADPAGEIKQQVYALRAMVLLNQKEDLKGGAADLKTALDAAPDTELAGRIRQFLDRLKDKSDQ